MSRPGLAEVLAFPVRPEHGDWTRCERDRLSELAGHLVARGARRQPTFGLSDRGDPWCVITDAADEVLVHVARIDGRFVAHDAAADAVGAGDSLGSAFDRMLGRARPARQRSLEFG